MIDRDYFAVNKNGKGKGMCDREMLALWIGRVIIIFVHLFIENLQYNTSIVTFKGWNIFIWAPSLSDWN